jgi:hypothetical protein
MTEPAMDFSLATLADADLEVLLAQAGPALQEALRYYRAGGSSTRPPGVRRGFKSFIDWSHSGRGCRLSSSTPADGPPPSS